jgi:hypothetical protein
LPLSRVVLDIAYRLVEQTACCRKGALIEQGHRIFHCLVAERFPRIFGVNDVLASGNDDPDAVPRPFVPADVREQTPPPARLDCQRGGHAFRAPREIDDDSVLLAPRQPVLDFTIQTAKRVDTAREILAVRETARFMAAGTQPQALLLRQR